MIRFITLKGVTLRGVIRAGDACTSDALAPLRMEQSSDGVNDEMSVFRLSQEFIDAS